MLPHCAAGSVLEQNIGTLCAASACAAFLPALRFCRAPAVDLTRHCLLPVLPTPFVMPFLLLPPHGGSYIPLPFAALPTLLPFVSTYHLLLP